MNCIIVDDEPKAIEIIAGYLEKIDSVLLSETFRNPAKAIQFLQTNKVDIIFLDVQMPQISGLDFIKVLNDPYEVILTTANAKYAMQGFDLSVTDYLLKPIPFDRFLKAINKAIRNIHTKNKTEETVLRENVVKIKTGHQTYFINASDILFLEKKANYVLVHLNDKKIITRLSFSEVIDLLPPKGFIRIHKSYIINVDHINYIEAQQVTIKRNQIPIGGVYRADFHKSINEDI